MPRSACAFAHLAQEFHCQLTESLGTVNYIVYESAHDNTNKMACATSEDQPGHPPSLIRIFAVRSMGS